MSTIISASVSSVLSGVVHDRLMLPDCDVIWMAARSYGTRVLSWNKVVRGFPTLLRRPFIRGNLFYQEWMTTTLREVFFCQCIDRCAAKIFIRIFCDTLKQKILGWRGRTPLNRDETDSTPDSHTTSISCIVLASPIIIRKEFFGLACRPFLGTPSPMVAEI